MSQARRVAKIETGNMAKGKTDRETVEVAEAIKALQSQLADLRKIVQAAKEYSDDAVEPVRRRQ